MNQPVSQSFAKIICFKWMNAFFAIKFATCDYRRLLITEMVN